MAGAANRLVGKRIADRYCITGEIGRGGMGIVYKAIPFDDPSHSVAIKVIQRSGRLNYDDIMRFQKEASLMSQLHHPNIVVFHELGLFGRDQDEIDDLGSGYYIVMEIADGTNLKESLARDGRKDLAYFFQVGLQVSAALDYTHGKNIIHRDIKPHNIIVGQAFRDQRGVLVKVLDFGVARLAEAMQYTGRDLSNGRGIEEAAGTPLYMAPEQTTLMEAPIDHRVDLYSLGCVLYELLAGKPPFTANSREKLEKQHVFADPEPLTHLRPDVPVLVEKIIHKLLAKHPSDRYQTAFALHADIRRAKSVFETAARPSAIAFPLGLKDRFQAVSAQLQLVGRDRELGMLIGEYDGVATARGRSRLTLIKGGAGIGKSRLMAEFQAYLARRRVRFVSGSFSQHENALPFNALANAFNEYLLRILKNYPHEVEELKRRFKTTIGPMAHMIAEVVPGLKPYLAEIPEEEERSGETQDMLASAETFSTFAKAFSDFTRCLSTDNQPIVFLFHDLHWADDKSLDLIDQFFSNANTLQFYLIISQRTGLHVANERFNSFIEKFRKLRRRFLEVELEKIEGEAIRQIVGHMLSSPESVTDPLVHYLEEQSKGNPMHLVELTRTLVASDLIFLRSVSGEWEFDIRTLRKTQIQLNTVDLILSRIQEYQEFDKQVLGVAATVGLTFQFEILLLGGRSQSVPVMKAIQRAMDEGLIIRVTDDPDLKHLGKTFMFGHKKARDAIYEGIEPEQRRSLHRNIGEKLEAAIPEPSEKTLFALAHHFNASLDGGRTDDLQLASRALKYNKKAGNAAYRSGAWQTAERYYENAWRIMDHWQSQIASSDERAQVREILADLAAVQKRHGRALSVYRELLQEPIANNIRANIAYKAIYFQIVGGIISETAKLIEGALKLIRKPLPKVNLGMRVRLLISFAIDALPLNKKQKRLHRLLNRAYASRKQDAVEADRQFPAIRLYQAGVILHMHERRDLALVYHELALKEALAGKGSPASLIKIVAERAALLGYLGFTRIAYRFLDLSMDLAKACKLVGVYGYVALLRVLTIDYIKGRHEEVSDNLKEAMLCLRPNDDRIVYGQGMLFKIFRELLRCNFTALYRYSQRMPDTIPTRNWLSPRSVAMMLFGYLLQGSRDSIVRNGEMFLKRRQKVAGRIDDLFIKVIHTLVAFARGEIDRTRESYQVTMYDFVARSRSEFLFPFEEDFIGIFALTFPILFEQEYGRHLMRAKEMEVLLLKLRRRIAQFKGQERAIPMLLIARASELMGDNRKVRRLYDAALKSAKGAHNNLVQIFAYLWFGSHLVDHGQPQKRDYIRRALTLADHLELKALTEYIRKLMEKRGFTVKDASLVSHSGKDVDQSHQDQTFRLFVGHLNHVSEAGQSDTPLSEDLEVSFGILSKYYKATRVFCILTDAKGQASLLYPGGWQPEYKQIIDYVEPYFNIRSTLFLPHNDAPWVHSAGKIEAPRSLARSHPNSGSHFDSLPEETPENYDFDAATTMVVDSPRSQSDASAAPAQTEAPVSAQATYRSVKVNDSAAIKEGVATSNTLQMSALIPLRANFDSLGVVFLESFGSLHNRDTTWCRQDLDQFGSQLGLIIERKSGIDVSSGNVGSMKSANAIYQPASFTLESIPWLQTWHHGRLRAQRETSWFLGLCFGQDQYVLLYCLLIGKESIRERLGSMIWHHLYVIRALNVASGRNHIELGELREEFTSLLAAMPKISQLENISLAFTIFDRDRQMSYSGHFGSSRPFVVGTENFVSPYNNVVLNYANGRDLRYWEVTADLGGSHTYLLSYDTSKLDMVQFEQLNRRLGSSSQRVASGEDLHKNLSSFAGEENLPRYYVAAIMRQDVETDEPPQLIPLDKAE